jgi:prepilin-type N-terminal cleavage/methylation domain-containing protein
MRKQRGLSLIEVLMALSIVLITFFTTLQIFAGGYRYYKRTHYSTELMIMGQQKLEEFARTRTVAHPADVNWSYLPGNNYRYRIKVDPYVNYNSSINYQIYMATLTAEGPTNLAGKKTTDMQTIVLKTLLVPVASYYPGKCRGDENAERGASNIIDSSKMERK